MEESHPEDEKIVMVVDYVEPVDSGAGGNVDDSVDDLPEMEAPVALATEESDEANSQPMLTEEAEPVVYKNKVERRIGEVMQNRDWSLETKRSPDLVPLTKEYQVYRKELAKLVKTTKDYLWANEKCNLMRGRLGDEIAWSSKIVRKPTDLLTCEIIFFCPIPAKMMAQCVSMSKDTPLYNHVGKPSGDAEDQADADQDDETHDIEALLEAGGALSLHSIEKLTSFYSKTSNEEFNKYVLTYATEWERVITSRLDQEIASVAYLQKRKVHYERKVDALRKTVMKIEKKPNKEVNPKLQEKLDRNEEKLSDSWKTHETQSAKLAVLLEESVRNGFRDLYTFLKNYSRFEINKATRTEVLKMKLKLNLLAMKAEQFDDDAEQPQQPSETFRVV